MDRVDATTRSRVMASVRAKGARSTEGCFQELLENVGIEGWRANAVDIIGKPDFVFDAARVAVFVDGCFWHGCPQHCRMPVTNLEYWARKIKRNQARDQQVKKLLAKSGWKTLRIWEHEVKANPELVLKKIRRTLARALQSRITE